ncbi:DUF502 domain-containing protein [Chlamydiales bacterium]|nr:DUF502 domain-containing protein [Chlamydiales bacterium]
MKRFFLTGFILILPFTFTLLITLWILELVSRPFFHFFIEMTNNFILSRLLSLILMAITVILIGFIGNNYFIKKMIQIGHRIILKIPFIRNVFQATNEVVQSMMGDPMMGTQGLGFSKAVLVNWPSKNDKIIGFLPNANIPEGELTPVFIPGAPNPLMGFLLFFNKSDIYPLDMGVKDAFKWTLSLGAVHPEKI